MAEARSNVPDRSPSSYYGEKSIPREKIDALLTMMDSEARQTIMTLANADAKTRRSVLAKLDPKTRAAMETIIENL